MNQRNCRYFITRYFDKGNVPSVTNWTQQRHRPCCARKLR